MGGDDDDILLALKPLLESNEVVKVIHSARSDSDVLWRAFGIVINNVYDTQVAHQMATNSKVQIGLNTLLEHYGCGTNPRKEEFGRLFNSQEKSRELFTLRPLDLAVIEYAAADVSSLAKAYRALASVVG